MIATIVILSILLCIAVVCYCGENVKASSREDAIRVLRNDVTFFKKESEQFKSEVERCSKLSSKRFQETIDLEEKIRTLVKEHESAIDNCNQENARQYEYIKKLQSDLHTLRSDVADRDKEIEEIINRYKNRYNTNTAAYKSFSSY